MAESVGKSWRDGLAPRTRFHPLHRRERNLEILRRADAGEKQADIADDLGITRSRILQIVKMMRHLRASPRSWANYLNSGDIHG
jgi:DNA-directed RNA polymerase sigma subunit (sigma70/sigma32)